MLPFSPSEYFYLISFFQSSAFNACDKKLRVPELDLCDITSTLLVLLCA